MKETYRQQYTNKASSYHDGSDVRKLAACHHCGTIHRRTTIGAHIVASCRECGSELYSGHPDAIDRGIALHLAAGALLVIVHVFPLITVEIQGNELSATVLSGVMALFEEGLWPVALASILFISIVPGLRILIGICTHLDAKFGRSREITRRAYKLSQIQGPWSMLEVYLLGLIVAYVKMMSSAEIDIGPAAIAMFATIILLAWSNTSTDPEDIWSRIGRPCPPEPQSGARVDCHSCGRIEPAAREYEDCWRCGSTLHRRKKQSLQRAWALLAASLVLYVPANTYPMMTVVQFGNSYPGTILGGVIDLALSGDIPVAAVIFIASIMVPVLKFLALGWLLLSVQFRWRERLRQKTRLYLIVEVVGRYSMVDVFVVAILAGLVQVGGVFAIYPGIGALAFCTVVVMTMIAAMSFDPRLLWDMRGRSNDRV